ncbi:MAG: translocation/assembly module TamB domain-containing protein, partial [Asticcacaulis sp.]|nr:translocation/assembly module TamB domain-containing protein [Asticcacaulis sp.]
GNAHVTGAYAYAPDGTFSIKGIKGKAPLFTLASADGRITRNGGIALKAAGTSTKYGPLDVVASGTVDRPTAILHTASPGFGVGLRDVTAHIATTEAGYTIAGDGGSDYGPVTADTIILKGEGPLRIDIRTATFAGITTSGLLTQTQGGPFAGTLAIGGSGLNGTAVLNNVGGDQGAVINATGSQVVVPGDMNIRIGRAILTANAVLRDQIELTGDVQMADATWQDFALATGRAKINLKGQRGTIQAVATGQKSVPFNIAVNGDIAPDVYTFAAKGQANGIPFTLDHPARVTRSGADWVLQPVTVVMEQGRVDLAGRMGEQMKFQARLHDMDLSVANLFSSDLGITGRADGSAEFAQSHGGFPTARLALKIDDFSRASAAVVSTPVDMTVDARLDPGLSPAQNYLHAIVRDGGNVVGRIQIDLAPTGGGNWVDGVMNAGLSGGVRYNGPAAVPFSLTGLARQNLTGAVAVAADFSGQVKAPRLNGVIKATSLTYDNETFGTRISQVALDGRFNNDKLELTTFSGRAGDGTVNGSGWVSLAAAEHFPMEVHVDLKNARLARSDSINSTVSGTLDVSNDTANGAVIKGDLRLPQLKYQVVKQGAAQVNVLDGVRKKGASDAPNVQTASIPASWKLDIRARADRQIFVSGMGLESEWDMDLNVIGTTADPRVIGEMNTVRGNYTFAGKGFTIDRGTIRFNGGPLIDPEIDIQASGDMQDVKGIIKVTGSAQRP